ncbi:GOLPH3/VPS74 family protein [Streptomyces sp. AM8-1-1]|uniref:GOLPH3/VPS74 family protein n=1 Tax=Streptomyces sp. AM8-1-1 TaxID=3075825 RepID=UPI0028C39B3C|nr:GPP34 family phosphoprotein [Streptomyces sp. AM8-1-1]WNO73057.1 GPP34 family phosphoprotein [Streptomyces sp. AM8-1-1]
MTTPRDLLIVAMDVEGTRDVGPGDLSLALAGAELIELLKTPTIRLDAGRIVPGHLPLPADPLLVEAAAVLMMDEPYELVGDWLWRRGDSLTEAYMAAFEADGLVVRQGSRPFRGGQRVLVDSPLRRGAMERWESGEPVLRSLAESLGIQHGGAEPSEIEDYAVAMVLGAVNDALLELEGERQKRGIEQAAFDNVWRGF